MTADVDVLANPDVQRALAEVLNSTDGAAGAVAGDLRALILRAQAAKLMTDAGALLDRADVVDQASDLQRVVAAATDALVSAETESSRIADAVKGAVVAEREAADKFTGAAEFAREARERVDDFALAEASPADQTDAILKRDAAEQVAGRFRATAEKATATRLQLDAALETARGAARRAKANLKTATDAVENPPLVEPSWWTCQLDGIRRVSAGRDLGRSGMAEVSQLVENLAVALGVDRIFAARTRTAIEEELQRKASAQILPARGSKAPVGQIVSPPGSPAAAPRLVPNR